MSIKNLICVLSFPAFIWFLTISPAIAQNVPVPADCTDGQIGSWSYSVHPFMGEGYEARPIVVTAVRTTAKTLTVSEVRIRNISSKSVSSIKLGWSISRNGQNTELVKSGESVLIPFKKPLAHSQTELLVLPLFSFSEMKSELEANKKLSGNFNGYIWVSQIWFEDNTHWKVGDKVRIEPLQDGTKIQTVSFNRKSGSLSVVPQTKATVSPK